MMNTALRGVAALRVSGTWQADTRVVLRRAR
jgi:hypothetical protein